MGIEVLRDAARPRPDPAAGREIHAGLRGGDDQILRGVDRADDRLPHRVVDDPRREPVADTGPKTSAHVAGEEPAAPGRPFTGAVVLLLAAGRRDEEIVATEKFRSEELQDASALEQNGGRKAGQFYVNNFFFFPPHLDGESILNS